MMQCRWQELVLVLQCLVALTSAEERHAKPSKSHIPRFAYDSNEQKKPYPFEFEVDAPHHGTWHDRREHSSGSQTSGQFRVALPDNRLQTVTYQATHDHGFQADVRFQQQTDLPSLKGYIGEAPTIGQSVVPAVKAKALSSSIMYPTASKHRIPKFDDKPSVGNEPRKGYTSSSKATVPAQDSYRMPREGPVLKGVNPHFTSTKKSISSHGLVSLKSNSKFIPSEGPKTNHFKIPGLAVPLPNFVPSRHTIRPMNSKSFTSRGRGRHGDQTRSHKVLMGKAAGGRPSRVKPSKAQSSSLSALLAEGIPVPHVPKNPPEETIEPPATKDESFNLANKERGRYKIRKEKKESVRSRLNDIVHR